MTSLLKQLTEILEPRGTYGTNPRQAAYEFRNANTVVGTTRRLQAGERAVRGYSVLVETDKRGDLVLKCAIGGEILFSFSVHKYGE